MEKTEVRQRIIEPTAANADEMGYALGKKIGEIGDKAVAQINALTSRFGVEAKIMIQLIDTKTGEPLT